ncbi:asparaginase [Aquibacillus rhizosphaerae]|uniref:asparaginase n=1 Tax=Aquibacillus rhizosphaerae TaxID=3051431 RepID=A0ABT7L4J1_9BACI|nr:asparaginase [Aquibacillus sp. LR5S19]MDL4840779.1 asparaginase [Aquibacillus sp. LR5S19]
MKNILVIHTGGTISMEEDLTTGAVTTANTHPLHNMTAMIREIANIEEEILFNLPSPHITPSHMLELAKKINNKISTHHIDGIVVTHGTDTLEETAYFLDLFLATQIPVVITGAMRSSNELGSDGPYNLMSSIRVAICDEATDKGVLVVMNDEIHTAKYVTKTSTSNVATFQSPQFGPIGVITKQAVNFYQKLITNESYPIKNITKNVALIKAYAGMDGSLIRAIQQSNVDGLVIEGFGQGNIPPEVIVSIKDFIADNKPVVLVSRCFKGTVQATYAYTGGGRHLKDLGVIFANGLTGQKARIKLLIALEITAISSELNSIFEI